MNTASVLNTKPSFENYLKVIELKIERLVLKKKWSIKYCELTFGDFSLLQDLNSIIFFTFKELKITLLFMQLSINLFLSSLL